ncbi:hypothetical protein DKG77_00800 [Flagellimonas aquimarina]|uniref:Uncharacterized protein n=1 Tax=Flagellimonas aquimarina TaxID=2201895 RepID=A0A316LH50_9FLAO|nr:dienelactone hydrolase family protein [Allomuricauda koreensis]PWL39410.1 hypothetical protein DKG77_00800 [Allomuricauda koreensis]
MKNLKKILYVLFSWLVTVGAFAQERVLELQVGKDKMLVRITVPENYSTSQHYPILLGPGLDNDSLENGCRYFGLNPETHGWILVESLVHMKDRKAVLVLLDYLEANYPVKSIFALGFSANSIDAFQIATQYSDKLAGVISMPGNPNLKDTSSLKKLSNQNVLMIVGEKDTYWKKKAEKAKEIMDKHKIRNKLVVVPNAGHILDEMAGPPLFDLLEEMINTESSGFSITN